MSEAFRSAETKPRETGGHAFPGEQGHIPDGTWNQTFEAGMTLRDWFAGKALSGFTSLNVTVAPEILAMWAYTQADAMLKERSK